MSREHSRTVRFECHNDCRQAGCPGHEMRIEYHHTSGTVSIMMDGKPRATFDQATWQTAVMLDNEKFPPLPVDVLGTPV